MKIRKAIILNTRDAHYIGQIIDLVKKKYVPKEIELIRPEIFTILKFRLKHYDLCIIPHRNWFGKGTINLEIFGYMLGAKKTIAYSVSLAEYDINFFSIFKKTLFELYKKVFVFFRLHNILDLIYNQMVLARRLKNENSVAMGENTAIRGYSQIDYYKNLSVGNNSAINYGFQAIGRGKIEIGNFVQIGPNVMISTANHNVLGKNYDLYPVKILNVKIEDNVWIGANSIILAGVTIGKGCIIGAGSVVRHSIPKNNIVMGNPAKIIVKKPT